MADPSSTDWHPSVDGLLDPDERVRVHLARCADCRLERARLLDAESVSGWTRAHLSDDDLMAAELGADGQEHLRQCAHCRRRRREFLDAEPTMASGVAPEPMVDPGSRPTDGGAHWTLLLRLLGQAGYSLRETRIVDPDRPIAVARRGRSENLIAAFTPEEGALVGARFAQVEGELHDTFLPWRDLRKLDGGWIAIADPPPERGVLETLELHPLSLVRLFGQAATAMATLHERGLVHGGLLGGALGVTATGRLRMAPPALHVLTTAGDDRRHLGGLLQDLCIGSDAQLTALVDLAIQLQQGGIATDGQLMARVLELWELVRAGAGRYKLLDPLGAPSAFGEVWRVHDAVVRRDVALKFMREGTRMDEHAFVSEARLTARLQHPNIVPIYNIGESFEGRPYYTMEEVRGSGMEAAIRALHERGSTGSTDAALRRMIDVFARIAETMAFAHDQGVVHCDLKPENVMVGAYGEVRVVDWGMAVEVGTTWRGGTPYYIPPEYPSSKRSRARPQADVYALGRVLYDILFGLRAESPAPDAAPVPQELVELARVCTRLDPDHRPPDGGAVAARVRAWLDGLFQRDRAADALQSVADKAAEADALRAEGARKRREAAALSDGVKPWDPIDRKLPSWQLEDAARSDERKAAVADTEYEQGIRAALEMDPGNQTALDALAEVYKARLLRAEAAKDEDEAVRIETLLSGHDGGRHAAWLRGDGAVTLVTDPPGAMVVVERYEVAARRLVPTAIAEIGPTPLVEHRLQRGSYRLRIRHPDCEEVLYPVFLERGEHWDGVPPEADQPAVVRLPRRGELDGGDCYVPAGWYWCGGDALAIDALARRRVWVDAFVARPLPVTHAEYIAFLGSLDPDERDRFVPTERHEGGSHAIYDRRADGRFTLPDPTSGAPWEGDWPVVLIDSGGAEAFAAWRSDRTGVQWRLPHDLEWEKAARGVDGRAFPWGDELDPSFALMGRSHQTDAQMGAVAAFAADVSPYGVRDLAGNVRDLCGNRYDYLGGAQHDEPIDFEKTPSRPDLCMVRGGSWTSVGAWCRSAARFTAGPEERSTAVGFRLVRTVL